MKYLVRLVINRIPKDLRDPVSEFIHNIGEIEKDRSFGGEEWTEYDVDLVYVKEGRRAPQALHGKVYKFLHAILNKPSFKLTAKVYPETVFERKG